MAIFIEFIIGSLLALYFHWILRYKEGALIIFGAGVLLSLATYLIREEIIRARRMLANLYHSGYEISEALSSIAEPVCREKSQELLREFKQNLILLKQGYLLLNEAEFYLEGSQALQQTTRHVRAVDPLLVGWESRGALLNYYQANLSALERGVKITRIFVISRRDCLNQSVQNVLQQQSTAGIKVRIAFREDLPLKSGEGYKNSLDFAIYNDTVVTDRSPSNAYYFGTKTCRTAEVEKYIRLFDLINHHSHGLLNERDAACYLKELTSLESS